MALLSLWLYLRRRRTVSGIRHEGETLYKPVASADLEIDSSPIKLYALTTQGADGSSTMVGLGHTRDKDTDSNGGPAIVDFQRLVGRRASSVDTPGWKQEKRSMSVQPSTAYRHTSSPPAIRAPSLDRYMHEKRGQTLALKESMDRPRTGRSTSTKRSSTLPV